MKHTRLATAAIAFSFFLLTGCEKEAGDAVRPTLVKETAVNSTKVGENITKGDGLNQRIGGLQPKISLEAHPEYRNMVLRALGAVEATPCETTEMNFWLNEQLDNWYGEDGYLDPAIADALDYAVLDLPTYHALYFENSSENQYYGVDGEYTKVITKTFKDLQRFFNIPSDEIVLAGMHGNMLLDRDKIIQTYEFVYGLPSDMAADFADIVVAYANEIPQFRGGDHPIFTFNAFAFNGWNFVPKKIIMGDGILDAFTALGYSDVAPQAILAHEFAHQVQYHLDLFEQNPENEAEATRRTELMADAYAAYYLSHARGATMQWKRVQQFLEVFYSLGDCSFASSGHHGTPTQRMAAAEWGYSLADSAQKQGHILTVEEFALLFDAQLPELVLF